MSSRTFFTRREFLQSSAVATGWIGTVLGTRAHAAPESNPFAYDVTHLAKTDPKLISYELVARFPSPHQEPRRIAIGPADQVYIANSHFISVLDRQGTPVREIALSAAPRCLALNSDGQLFVGFQDHVEVYDPKGQRRATWPSPVPCAWLTGMVAWKNELFVADAGNRVLLRCDSSGKVLSRIGEKNKARNIPGFIVPSPFFDVEMHPDGLLRVTNPGRHRVETYTVDGDLELTWGKPSAAIDGFCGCCNPINIALLADGRIVTCEKGLPRVKIYRADGMFESVVAGPELFPENARHPSGDGLMDCTRGGLDAAVDSQGRIYVLDIVDAGVRVLQKRASA